MYSCHIYLESNAHAPYHTVVCPAVPYFATLSHKTAGHVARMGDGRGVHRLLVGKPEGKRLLERPRHRWEYNFKTDLQEVGGGGD